MTGLFNRSKSEQWLPQHQGGSSKRSDLDDCFKSKFPEFELNQTKLRSSHGLSFNGRSFRPVSLKHVITDNSETPSDMFVEEHNKHLCENQFKTANQIQTNMNLKQHSIEATEVEDELFNLITTNIINNRYR
jgi:hypothetical protein